LDILRKEYSTLGKLKVWFGRKSVIVFTMGKVGTLTVCNSLRAVGYKHVHPHSLRYTRPGVHFLKINLSIAERFKYFIKTFLKRTKVWVWKKLKNEILIITGVRDPYSRNISAYFEQVHYLGGISPKATISQIRDQFDATCDFDAPINWFDKEVLQVTGINVFDYTFDKDKGLSIITKGKFKLLVFRIDKLNGLEHEISKFIGDENFRILSTNSSDDGQYIKQLKEYKNKYKYEIDKVKKFSNSIYMSHFYKPEEIENFALRWGASSKE
jgi:hypothetical protein